MSVEKTCTNKSLQGVRTTADADSKAGVLTSWFHFRSVVMPLMSASHAFLGPSSFAKSTDGPAHQALELHGIAVGVMADASRGCRHTAGLAANLRSCLSRSGVENAAGEFPSPLGDPLRAWAADRMQEEQDPPSAARTTGTALQLGAPLHVPCEPRRTRPALRAMHSPGS